jgi:hypothetical protein
VSEMDPIEYVLLLRSTLGSIRTWRSKLARLELTRMKIKAYWSALGLLEGEDHRRASDECMKAADEATAALDRLDRYEADIGARLLVLDASRNSGGMPS